MQLRTSNSLLEAALAATLSGAARWLVPSRVGEAAPPASRRPSCWARRTTSARPRFGRGGRTARRRWRHGCASTLGDGICAASRRLWRCRHPIARVALGGAIRHLHRLGVPFLLLARLLHHDRAVISTGGAISGRHRRASHRRGVRVHCRMRHQWRVRRGSRPTALDCRRHCTRRAERRSRRRRRRRRRVVLCGRHELLQRVRHLDAKGADSRPHAAKGTCTPWARCRRRRRPSPRGAARRSPSSRASR